MQISHFPDEASPKYISLATSYHFDSWEDLIHEETATSESFPNTLGPESSDGPANRVVKECDLFKCPLSRSKVILVWLFPIAKVEFPPTHLETFLQQPHQKHSPRGEIFKCVIEHGNKVVELSIDKVAEVYGQEILIKLKNTQMQHSAIE